MKFYSLDSAKRLVLSLLPHGLLYWLWHLKTRQRSRTAITKVPTPYVIPLQPGVELFVYWEDVPGVGEGPAASLFVLREEVMRFDCTGGNRGHMHINPVQVSLLVSSDEPPRSYFAPGNRAEHVERAAFELSMNAESALRLNQLPRIRNFPLEVRHVAGAASQMKRCMLDLLASHGQI